jgi:hypothetical protein
MKEYKPIIGMFKTLNLHEYEAEVRKSIQHYQYCGAGAARSHIISLNQYDAAPQYDESWNTSNSVRSTHKHSLKA